MWRCPRSRRQMPDGEGHGSSQVNFTEGTLYFLTEIFGGSRGVPVAFVDVDEVPPERLTEHFITKIGELRPPVVFIEPMSNPRLLVLDIGSVAEATRRVGAILI